MRLIFAFLLFVVQAASATAQDDKDMMTGYLETALSSSGYQVSITGFAGALSARATMKKLTIADEKGVWLVLSDVVLDWNRASVLRGEIDINELSAAQMDMPRLPESSGPTRSPEAKPFALPELPVSLRIGKVSLKKVRLGQPVVGVAVEASVSGNVTLAAGQGAAKLAIVRQGGPDGTFNLNAGFANETRVLSLELSLREGADGIVANLLNLPEKPPLDLSIKGMAPLDDFTARVALSSAGRERLSGEISTQAGRDMLAGVARVADADIRGDLTPLFAPQYRRFLGKDMALKTRLSLFEDGRMALDELALKAAGLQLSGQMVLAADGLPEAFHLNGVLQDPAGAASLLPLSGPETRVERATLQAQFDSRAGETWSLRSQVDGFERDDVSLDALGISAGGQIRRGTARQVTAHIDASADGLLLGDKALAEALGSRLGLLADLVWRDGAPLDVQNLAFEANGVSMKGAGQVFGIDEAFAVDGAVAATSDNLARFSKLVGRPLGGSLTSQMAGRVALLGGEADLRMTAEAKDLSLGIGQVDRLLGGMSQMQASVARDENGLLLRMFEISAAGGSGEASGRVATGDSALTYRATLKDVGPYVNGLNGPATVSGEALEDMLGWRIILDGRGPRAIELTSQVSLPKAGGAQANVSAQIGSIGWILPDLEGAARLEATVEQAGENWALEARASGPGGSAVTVGGQVAATGQTGALNMTGRVPLGLLNRRLKPNSAEGFALFDMALNGPLALSSLRGEVRTSQARLSLPALRNALTDVDAKVTLSEGAAQVRATSNVASGGTLEATGGVGLRAPYAADVEIAVSNVTVSSPKLYSTRVNGALTLEGALARQPLVTGRLLLDETELRIPSTGIGAFGEIPEITHRNEPTAVRQTRSFAGLLADAGGVAAPQGAGLGLDVEIVAEKQIFVRGRGLDAELGGRVQMTGTTADIIPKGRFELIRGRLDILGKRLDLEEGAALLQGSLIPQLRLVARTSTDDTVVFVTVSGPADAPEIQFTSVPELPSDEVLAQLLFGRDVRSMSALQAVQLASAVATLAGQGGLGVVDKLRQKTGVDELDVSTSDTGETSLRAGKYISDGAYTEVEIDSSGQSTINLNLDLSNAAKLRGSVDTEGQTGVGLFFEKDY